MTDLDLFEPRGQTTYGDGVYNLAESIIYDARIQDVRMRLAETHELAQELQRTIDAFFDQRAK